MSTPSTQITFSKHHSRLKAVSLEKWLSDSWELLQDAVSWLMAGVSHAQTDLDNQLLRSEKERTR